MMPSLKNVIWWMPFSPVQCKYSSPLELEDQNCLFSARECVDSEDDLIQFWCGNGLASLREAEALVIWLMDWKWIVVL